MPTAGRKTKYEYWLTEDGILRLEGWARDGLTDADISCNIGINQSTLVEWKKRFPQINEALKKNKEVVDRIVENALFKRATGYRYKETVTETVYDAAGNPHKNKRTTRKDMPPDTGAAIFWLKNRRPDHWREKQEGRGNTSALEKLDAILAENLRIASNEADRKAK